MSIESDTADIRRRFEEVFGAGSAADHALFERMMTELKGGRSKLAILADIDEADTDKSRAEKPAQAGGWHNEHLTV